MHREAIDLSVSERDTASSLLTIEHRISSESIVARQYELTCNWLALVVGTLRSRNGFGICSWRP